MREGSKLDPVMLEVTEKLKISAVKSRKITHRG